LSNTLSIATTREVGASANLLQKRMGSENITLMDVSPVNDGITFSTVA
jgi:hypothetical protein